MARNMQILRNLHRSGDSIIDPLHQSVLPTGVIMYKTGEKGFYRALTMILQTMGDEFRMFGEYSNDRSSFARINLYTVSHIFTSRPQVDTDIPVVIVLCDGVDERSMHLLAVCSRIWNWTDPIDFKTVLQDAITLGYVHTWDGSCSTPEIQSLIRETISNQSYVGAPVHQADGLHLREVNIKKQKLDPAYLAGRKLAHEMITDPKYKSFNIGDPMNDKNIIENEFPLTPREEAFEDVFIEALNQSTDPSAAQTLWCAQTLLLSFSIASTAMISDNAQVREMLIRDIQGVKGLYVEKICQLPSWTESGTRSDSENTLAAETEYASRLKRRGRVISNLLVWFFITTPYNEHPSWYIANLLWQAPFMDERHRGVVIEQAMVHAPEFVLTMFSYSNCWNQALYYIALRSAHLNQYTIPINNIHDGLAHIGKNVLKFGDGFGVPQSNFNDSMQCWVLAKNTGNRIIRTSYMQQESGTQVLKWLRDYVRLLDPFEWTNVSSTLQERDIIIIICNVKTTRRLVGGARCQMNRAPNGHRELYIEGVDVLKIDESDKQAGDILFGAIETIASVLSCHRIVLFPAYQFDRERRNGKYGRPMKTFDQTALASISHELKMDDTTRDKIVAAVYKRDHTPSIGDDLQKKVYAPRGYTTLGPVLYKSIHPSFIPGIEPSVFRTMYTNWGWVHVTPGTSPQFDM